MAAVRLVASMIGLAALGGELDKVAIEHTQAIPTNEAIVDCFVRTTKGRRIAPAQPASDDEEHAAHDPGIIEPRCVGRQWETGLEKAHLDPAEQSEFRRRQRLLNAATESAAGGLGQEFLSALSREAIARRTLPHVCDEPNTRAYVVLRIRDDSPIN